VLNSKYSKSFCHFCQYKIAFYSPVTGNKTAQLYICICGTFPFLSHMSVTVLQYEFLMKHKISNILHRMTIGAHVLQERLHSSKIQTMLECNLSCNTVCKVLFSTVCVFMDTLPESNFSLEQDNGFTHLEVFPSKINF
jgi:hypothetical protein